MNGKVAIVTGGNDGIGAVVAHCFAKEGAKVAILARNEEKGQRVAQSIRNENGEAKFIECDVTQPGSIKDAIAQVVEVFGGLNVLCNNAGVANINMFPNESLGDWEQVLKVNLTGTFLVTQAVWPHLIASGGGAVVSISSMAAVNGFNENTLGLSNMNVSASYYASKAGIEGFTRYAASIGSSHNIRVNCVRPGQILTPSVTGPDGRHLLANTLEPPQMIKGPGKPEDVANAVLFLSTEDSRFITATILNLDGGSSAKV
ncbi:MAG: SDR family NAD(P)-dependent oxidoreductase [Cyanobacteria bacterium P01_H01_bin.15]